MKCRTRRRLGEGEAEVVRSERELIASGSDDVILRRRALAGCRLS